MYLVPVVVIAEKPEGKSFCTMAGRAVGCGA